MKKLALIPALLVSATAFAGYKAGAPVYVSSTSASGALGSARNSADTNQYIDCYSQSNLGVCGARDAGNKYAFCITEDPEIISVIRSVSGDSYVAFYFDKTGTCTDVTVYNNSYSPPKTL